MMQCFYRCQHIIAAMFFVLKSGIPPSVWLLLSNSSSRFKVLRTESSALKTMLWLCSGAVVERQATVGLARRPVADAIGVEDTSVEFSKRREEYVASAVSRSFWLDWWKKYYHHLINDGIMRFVSVSCSSDGSTVVLLVGVVGLWLLGRRLREGEGVALTAELPPYCCSRAEYCGSIRGLDGEGEGSSEQAIFGPTQIQQHVELCLFTQMNYLV